MTLVDSNVLIDILSNDRKWFAWSLTNLEHRAAEGPLIINEIIYAELSIQLRSQAELDEAIVALGVELRRIPEPALFLAGKVFRRYRQGGGVRTGVLPDFFIGAHAQISDLPLLTRDVGRYRTYFPKVALISPED